MSDRALLNIDAINPICSSPQTLQAAFDALVALATGCVENLKFVTDTIREMFYETDPVEINEWEYLPPVGPRPARGFVGLKNAGATCYMNSVLQQVRVECINDFVIIIIVCAFFPSAVVYDK